MQADFEMSEGSRSAPVGTPRELQIRQHLECLVRSPMGVPFNKHSQTTIIEGHGLWEAAKA
jgi:hypothetical protein